jgi:3'-phosphoadenosine 5'-phosphosulfate sulfotransferase (PAPS reductase)/FAD synthetase
MITHVLSFSGGKDSTALYLLAHERREQIAHRDHDIEVVFADTGHEHPLTYEFVRELPTKVMDGLPIRWVKADFSADFARKRAFVEKHWPEHGVPAARVERAIQLLSAPTGIPFLDLCMMKGRFPSTRRRFCSEETKHKPVFDQVQAPILATGRDVWSWQGVRADESESRRHLPRMDLALTHATGAELVNVRPIHRWTVEQVFAMHRRHGVAPNPLYLHGMGRVGCFPCIHCTKDELKQIGMRFPEEIDRVDEWEVLVGEASKRGVSTFFSYDKIPGDHQHDTSAPMPRIRDVVEWSRTGRGGRQFDLLLDETDGVTCSSLYGLCE